MDVTEEITWRLYQSSKDRATLYDLIDVPCTTFLKKKKREKEIPIKVSSVSYLRIILRKFINISLLLQLHIKRKVLSLLSRLRNTFDNDLKVRR